MPWSACRSVMSWLRGPDYALEAEVKEIESLVTDAAQAILSFYIYILVVCSELDAHV